MSNGRTVSYTYDELGNKVGIGYPDESTAQYEYDKNSRMTKVTDGDNKVSTYVYDANGNLIQECRRETTDPGSEQNYQWTYDKLNQMTSATITAEGKPTVKTSYEYDTVGNMSY